MDITINLSELGLGRINAELDRRLSKAIKRTQQVHAGQSEDWIAAGYYGSCTTSGGLAELALYYHLTGDADASFEWWVKSEKEDPFATADLPGFIEVKQATGKKQYDAYFPNCKATKLRQIKAANQIWFAQADGISTAEDKSKYIGKDTKRKYYAKTTTVQADATITFRDVLIVNDIEDLLKTDLFMNCGLDKYKVKTGKTVSYKFKSDDWDFTTKPTEAEADARELLAAALAA